VPALYTCFAVVRGRALVDAHSEKWLHLVCWGSPLLVGFVALAMNEYGPEGAWCGLPRGLWVFHVIYIFAGLICSSVCYVVSALVIRTLVRRLTSTLGIGASAKGSPQDILLKKACQLPVFVLIYIIQWIPYAIYAILLAFNLSYYEMNLVAVITVNSGGIWNSLAYRSILSKESSPMQKTSKTAVSFTQTETVKNETGISVL
jgi:small-conductance mechanosensitive channel